MSPLGCLLQAWTQPQTRARRGWRMWLSRAPSRRRRAWHTCTAATAWAQVLTSCGTHKRPVESERDRLEACSYIGTGICSEAPLCKDSTRISSADQQHASSMDQQHAADPPGRSLFCLVGVLSKDVSGLHDVQKQRRMEACIIVSRASCADALATCIDNASAIVASCPACKTAHGPLIIRACM